MQPQYQQQQHFQPQQQYHAAAPSQPPLWMPPMDQAAAYEALFREADPANAGTVAGDPAVEFLRHSALPDETLRLVHSVLIISTSHLITVVYPHVLTSLLLLPDMDAFGSTWRKVDS